MRTPLEIVRFLKDNMKPMAKAYAVRGYRWMRADPNQSYRSALSIQLRLPVARNFTSGSRNTLFCRMPTRLRQRSLWNQILASIVVEPRFTWLKARDNWMTSRLKVLAGMLTG